MVSQKDRNYSDWISTFLEATKESEAPTRFRLWTAISLISSCLARKAWLNWDGQLFSNMYIILVGPAGSMKGTAMRIPKKLLTDMRLPVASDATTREQFMVELANARKFFEYKGKQIWHSSLTLFSKEINVIINERNKDLIINLIDWFDCAEDFSYRTKGSLDSEVAGAFLTMIGAITPDLLAKSMPPESRGSGFISRTNFIYAAEKEKIIYFPEDIDRTIYTKLLKDLEIIAQLKGEFIYDPLFVEPWIEYVDYILGNPKFAGTLLESYDNRIRIHTLKLCMILNSSRRDGNMIITEMDLRKAIEILDDAKENMLKAFTGLGTAKHADLIPRILDKIRLNGTIKFSELLASLITDISKNDLMDVIATLLASNLIEYSKIENKTDFYIFLYGTKKLLKDRSTDD